MFAAFILFVVLVLPFQEFRDVGVELKSHLLGSHLSIRRQAGQLDRVVHDLDVVVVVLLCRLEQAFLHEEDVRDKGDHDEHVADHNHVAHVDAVHGPECRFEVLVVAVVRKLEACARHV